ncbi:MAG: hypothetical protein C0614_11105 [Desulfuromonas sp.]|nr:MAG: hypothetical protein C0614_11105 [Desulfuromonas sp.]
MNLYRMIALALFCLLLTACAGSQGTALVSQNQQKFEQIDERATLSAADEVFISLKKAISNHYYVNQKLKVTRVYMNEFSSSLDDEGLLKNYLSQHIRENIEGANQLTLGDFATTGVDCILDLGLENIGRNMVKITSSIIDNSSGRTVANYSKVYPESVFSTDDVRVFANRFNAEMNRRQEYGNTRLMVLVDTKGKGFDDYEVHQSTYSSNYSGGGNANLQYSDSDNYSADASGDYGYSGQRSSTYTSKTKLGRILVYPTDVEVHVDGRPYQVNSEGLAFDQLVKPGQHKVFVTFREGSWDGTTNTEYKGKRYSKSFMVDMRKDQTLRFELALGFDNQQPKIDSQTKDITGQL